MLLVRRTVEAVLPFVNALLNSVDDDIVREVCLAVLTCRHVLGVGLEPTTLRLEDECSDPVELPE